MKIIDVHMHFAKNPHFDILARESGHVNDFENVGSSFAENGIVLGIGMGNAKSNGGGPPDRTNPTPLLIDLGGDLDLENYNYPGFTALCLGINGTAYKKDKRAASHLYDFAKALECRRVVGLKVYAGYNPVYVSDPVYHPFYDLAEKYDVPVVIHTGDTALGDAQLKYSHPLTVDEAAVKFPKTRFVMAHFGSPWLTDAAEVAKKNKNVFIDISGLAVGNFDVDEFCSIHSGYISLFKTWSTYLGRWDKIMYGSDWPLVNMGRYIELMKRVTPERHHEDIFFKNALRVFGRLREYVS